MKKIKGLKGQTIQVNNVDCLVLSEGSKCIRVEIKGRLPNGKRCGWVAGAKVKAGFAPFRVLTVDGRTATLEIIKND